MISLYTTFYNEQNIIRKSELAECLKLNISNPAISKIVVLYEVPIIYDHNNKKIRHISVGRRPNYSDYFRIVNGSSYSEDINIIANSDIFFDHSIKNIELIDFADKCFALSRWDIQPDGSAILFNRNDSQDVWIFKGKIKEGVFGDFPVGVPFCDNRIMFELQKAGYKVLNPSFSIKAYHLHAGKREEYKKENLSIYVDPPYRYRYPHNLYSLPRTLWFNLTHKEKLGRYRYDPKKINRWWPVRLFRKLYESATGNRMRLIGYR